VLWSAIKEKGQYLFESFQRNKIFSMENANQRALFRENRWEGKAATGHSVELSLLGVNRAETAVRCGINGKQPARGPTPQAGNKPVSIFHREKLF